MSEQILDDAAEEIAKTRWYRKLLAQLQETLDRERMTLLRTKHEIGKALHEAKAEVIRQGVTDERGWSGLLGKMMLQLSKDLDYSVSDLYRAFKFYEVFPDFAAFQASQIEVVKTEGGVSQTLRISGAEASWNQVVTSGLLFSDSSGASSHKTQEEKNPCFLADDECFGDITPIVLCARHDGDFQIWLNDRPLMKRLEGRQLELERWLDEQDAKEEREP